jgi:hypothetical protein
VARRRAEVLRLIAGTSIGAPQVVAAALDSFVPAAGELPEQEWWQRWGASSDFDGQATL